MIRLTTIAAAAMFCSVLPADEYVYMITAPVETVNHPAASAAGTLIVGGWTDGSAAALEQTSFAGWMRATSSATALDARKPTGTMLLFR